MHEPQDRFQVECFPSRYSGTTPEERDDKYIVTMQGKWSKWYLDTRVRDTREEAIKQFWRRIGAE